MAMSEHDIQAHAMKAHKGRVADKMEAACFGSPQGYANGGSVSPWADMYKKPPAPAPIAPPVAPVAAPVAPVASIAPIVAKPIAPPVPAAAPGPGMPTASTFGTPSGGGYKSGILATDQQPGPWNALVDANKPSPSGYPMADGGSVKDVVKNVNGYQARLDAAELAASQGPGPVAAPAPGAPAPASKPITGAEAKANYDAMMARQNAPTPAKPAGTLDKLRKVFGMSAGGDVAGPGGPREDKIPAMLSNGEYVLPERTATKLGGPVVLDKIVRATNDGREPNNAAKFGQHFERGGAPWDPAAVARARDAAEEAARQAGRATPAAAPIDEAGQRAAHFVQQANATAAQTPAVEAAAPKRGLLSRIVNPDIPAKGLLKSGLAIAPVLGAIDTATEASNPRAGLTGSGVGDTAARFLENTGNAATFGLAGRLGEGIASVAGGGSFFDGAAQSKPGAGASAPAPAAVPGAAIPGAGVTPAVDPLAAQKEGDARRATMAKGSAGYTPLGDFGVAGTQIFGRSSNGSKKMNDFVGSGDGTAAPSNGVTLGVRPGEVDAYLQSLADTGDRYRREANAPRPVAAEGGGQNQAAIDQLNQRLRGGAFTKQEGKLMTAQLKELNGQAAQFGQASAARYATDMHAYTSANNAADAMAMQRENNAATRATANATNEVARQTAKYTYDTKLSEVENARRKEAYGEHKDRLVQTQKDIDNIYNGQYGADTPQAKTMAATVGGLAATRMFPGADGKQHYIYDLDEKSKAAALGKLHNDALNNQAVTSTGNPGSSTGGIENRPSTLAEKAVFGARNLGAIPGLVMHGANTSGDKFGAVRPNSADSTLQATRARIASHPIAQQWNAKPGSAAEYAAALQSLSKVYGPDEAKAVLSRPKG